MGARGDFYDYRDKDGLGRVCEVRRRLIHPTMRVCKEWGSLLLNEHVKVVCDDQGATDWIGEYFSSTNFVARAQDTVVRAFGRSGWVPGLGRCGSISTVRRSAFGITTLRW